ncbi:head-tail connector protein [Pararhizobium haloflavum]|uniref:head-tail connector protein n=1 Tax=Pararhizobium haloflavum TaxID=2037914 RepID=UPI000C180344|nr:head-tail connector protein [Pararhizobium haloflavum]
MTIVVTDPAVGEALTLAEAKAHLRVEHQDEDELIEALIRTAREYLEAAAGLSLLHQSFRLFLDDWPKAQAILIRKHPVRSLDAVVVYDGEGMPQEMDLATVRLDTARRPARLVVAAMPAPAQLTNGIEIEFTAGYGESGADVPDVLKRAMLLHIAAMYALRGAVGRDHQPATVPPGYERLIAPYCRKSL